MVDRISKKKSSTTCSPANKQ